MDQNTEPVHPKPKTAITAADMTLDDPLDHFLSERSPPIRTQKPELDVVRAAASVKRWEHTDDSRVSFILTGLFYSLVAMALVGGMGWLLWRLVRAAAGA